MNIAYNAHKGQYDKAGIPYIFHPAYLAGQFDTEDEIIVSMLHDVVEDTDVTLEYLRQMGFTNVVVDAIDAITHRNNTPYFEYIGCVAANPLARRVKIKDIKHNGNPTRKILSQYESTGILKRMERYTKALKILEDAEIADTSMKVKKDTEVVFADIQGESIWDV